MRYVLSPARFSSLLRPYRYLEEFVCLRWVVSMQSNCSIDVGSLWHGNVISKRRFWRSARRNWNIRNWIIPSRYVSWYFLQFLLTRSYLDSLECHLVILLYNYNPSYISCWRRSSQEWFTDSCNPCFFLAFYYRSPAGLNTINRVHFGQFSSCSSGH